ncbi:MAG: hypothetical protein N2260_02040 [Syntrophobacterales bacterium]|nr:hypothetical protein [Syntrophobacterales bacterium]
MSNCDLLIFHPTGGWGGAERTTCNIAKALQAESIHPMILSNEKRFLEHLKGEIQVHISDFKPWFEKWPGIFKDLYRLIAILRSLKPRVLLGMMPYGAFLASIVRRLTPLPFIHVASPRGSCLNYLSNFVPTSKERIRYRFFF